MDTVFSARVLMMASLLVAILAGCDTATVNQGPQIRSLVASETELEFRSDDSLPVIDLTLSASDPDGDPLSTNWSSSGGVFVESGSAMLANPSSNSVAWSPDPLAGDYSITVTVSDGEVRESRMTTISVRPSITGVWIGTIGLVDQDFERAGFCLSAQPSGQVTDLHFGLARNGPGTTGSYRRRRTVLPSTYEYPTLRLASDDSRDEPIVFVASLQPDGQVLTADVELEGVPYRGFELQRTSSTCSSLQSVLVASL